MKKKCIFIGIDGAGRELFDKLDKKGIIPNISRIIKKSVYQDIESTMPPLTAPAWTSILTGHDPSQHGIFFWQTPFKINKKKKLLTGSDIKTPILPEVLNKAGYSSGMINFIARGS